MKLQSASPIALFTIAFLFSCGPVPAGTFCEDDPVWQDDDRLDMPEPKEEGISKYYDFLENTFSSPEASDTGPALNVNTLGEVPDSSWYTNRHYLHPRSIEQLTIGPDRSGGPSMDGGWRIMSGKSQGITPGFVIVDASGDRYLVKFDPLANIEMATGAEVVSTKFFHALGYFTPENYLVQFDPQQLEVDPKAMMKNAVGKKLPLARKKVEKLLEKVPRTKSGEIRAVASRFIEGKPLGPHRYYDTRPDDGNDIFPHQRRRELRGLGVFSAWLNHDDSRSINSLDVLVKEGGRQFVRHYLIDFGSTLGSGSVFAQKRRSGNEYVFEFTPIVKSIATFGLWLRPWVNVAYPKLPSVGRFESEYFDPRKWKPEYPNPAFSQLDADDAFWAAKQVMNFSDEAIRAVVSMGRYSDPEAERYLAETLKERRDKIGLAYLSHGGGLDRFAVRDGNVLVFDDLPVRHGFRADGIERSILWQVFDNPSGKPGAVLGAGTSKTNSLPIPASAEAFLQVTIETPTLGRTTVFLRNKTGTLEVVGIHRSASR